MFLFYTTTYHCKAYELFQSSYLSVYHLSIIYTYVYRIDISFFYRKSNNVAREVLSHLQKLYTLHLVIWCLGLPMDIPLPGVHMSAVYRVWFEYVSQSSCLNSQFDSIEKWDPPELIRSRHLCLLEIFAFLAPLEVDTWQMMNQVPWLYLAD